MKIAPFAPALGSASTLALLLGLVVSTTSHAAGAPDAQRTLDGKVSATVHAVRIDHSHGPVTVVGVDHDFGWHWVLTCSGDQPQAETFAKDCELQVAETNGTLQIRFVMPNRDSVRLGHGLSSWSLFGWSWTHVWSNTVDVNSRLELRLPRAAAVELKNRFGSSTVSDLQGALHLDGQNSAVTLSDLAGAVTATTSFAHLHVERTGAAQLHNQNGPIQALDIRGDLQAATSFGKLRVQGVKGRADLKNQNGEIEAEAITGDLVAATSFGRLTVHAVTGRADLHNQNATIDAHAIDGDLVAESSFATLQVAQIGGRATLRCQNGRIEATGMGQTVTASNSFSPLHVDGVQGDATLESQNGEIAAHGVTGALRAKTTFGRIQLEGDGRRCEADNQNGAVQITAHAPDVERIAATTSFGAIDVQLAPECHPIIHANTTFGKVKSDFPLGLDTALPEKSTVPNLSQPEVTLRGQNGDIRIQLLASQ